MYFVAGSTKIKMSMILVRWVFSRPCECIRGVGIIEGIGTYGGRASKMRLPGYCNQQLGIKRNRLCKHDDIIGFT